METSLSPLLSRLYLSTTADQQSFNLPAASLGMNLSRGYLSVGFELLAILALAIATVAQASYMRNGSGRSRLAAGLALIVPVCVLAALAAGYAEHWPRTKAISWTEDGIYLAGVLAEAVSGFSALAGLPSTARAAYHLLSCLLWIWIPETQPTLSTSAAIRVQAMYGVAAIVDIFAQSADKVDVVGANNGLSLVSQATCAWLTPVLMAGNILSYDNFPEAPIPSHDFTRNQLSFITACSSPMGPLRLFLHPLVHSHAAALAVTFFLRLIDDVSKLALPWLLRSLLANPTRDGIVILFCSRTFGSVCGNLSNTMTRRMAVEYKATIGAALYLKTLHLGLQRTAQDADISTLSEVDSQRIYEAVLTIHDLWSAPLQVLLTVGGLAYLLSWRGLLAVIVICALTFPTMRLVFNRMGYYVGKGMERKDGRTRLTSDILKCIKSIKMHAWESAFEQRLDERRKSEVDTLRGLSVYNALIVSITQIIPSTLTIAAFGMQILDGGVLDSQLIFASIMLLTMLNNNLQMMPGLMMEIQVIITSISRIRTFLSHSEVILAVNSADSNRPAAVTLRDVTLGWPGSSHLLKNASLSADRGSLTLINGAAGSGKSTLLLAMMGYLSPEEGSIQLRGSIAYASQEPFLISGTVRDNILFGRAYNSDWYDKVVEACALLPDFDRLHQGDLTILNGAVALSGGQKARIGLARAAYSNADIYLLDDPLAAIDINVQKSILRNLIGRIGLLGKATRIVVSNSPGLLVEADSTYTLQAGLLQQQDGNTSLALGEAAEGGNGLEELKTLVPNLVGGAAGQATLDNTHGDGDLNPLEDNAQRTGEESVNLPAAVSSASLLWRYISYARFYGWHLGIGIQILGRTLAFGSTYMLKIMTAETSRSALVTDLAAFGLLAFGQAVMFFLFIFVVYRLCTIPTGRKIHYEMVAAILAQPVQFFETTSSGEILNFFTNDLGRLDTSMLGSILSLCAQTVSFGLTCLILVIAAPVSLLFLVPVILLCGYMQRLYVQRLREIRHLEVSSRAPVLTQIEEADRGKVLFTVFGYIEDRVETFHHSIVENSRALLALVSIDVWLVARLEVLSTTLQVLAISAMIAMSIEVSTIGFVMTYVFQVTYLLSAITRYRAQLEGDLVSLGRAFGCIALGGDHMLSGDAKNRSELGLSTLTNWPTEGCIQFQSFSTRYQPDLPLSLESITLNIAPGDKVAVVGRTGAGKSSLVLSLLGLLKPASGKIIIDKLDLSELSGTQLRRRVATIPQNPVVFPGTIKENMDPLELFSDEQAAHALRDSGAEAALKPLLARKRSSSDPAKSLLDVVLDAGSDLSTGEIQLLALGRAMLQSSKLLILDEATAGLDQTTERLVHETLAKSFPEATTIAVTHKLNSTFKYDKVLVLEAGKIVEFDSPSALLTTTNGAYASMLSEAGLLEAALQELNEP